MRFSLVEATFFKLFSNFYLTEVLQAYYRVINYWTGKAQWATRDGMLYRKKSMAQQVTVMRLDL